MTGGPGHGAAGGDCWRGRSQIAALMASWRDWLMFSVLTPSLSRGLRSTITGAVKAATRGAITHGRNPAVYFPTTPKASTARLTAIIVAWSAMKRTKFACAVSDQMILTGSRRTPQP